MGGSTITGAGSVPKQKLGSKLELVPRDSKKNIRIKENNKTYIHVHVWSIQISLTPDAKEFQVSTANVVMIMLFNLKYVSETLRKLYGNIKHQFKF